MDKSHWHTYSVEVLFASPPLSATKGIMLPCIVIEEDSSSKCGACEDSGRRQPSLKKFTERQMTWICPTLRALEKPSKAMWWVKQTWPWSQTFWIQKLSLPLPSFGSHLHSLALLSSPTLEQCFLVCIRFKGVTGLVLLHALWEPLLVTSSQTCVAGMTLFRDVILSRMATLVLQPES